MIVLTTFIASGLSLGIVAALKFLCANMVERMQGNTAADELDRSFRTPLILVLASELVTVPISIFQFVGGSVKIQSLPGGGKGAYFLYNEQLVFDVGFHLPMLTKVAQVGLVSFSLAIFVFAITDRQKVELKSAVFVAAAVYGAGALAFFMAFPVMFTFFNPS